MKQRNLIIFSLLVFIHSLIDPSNSHFDIQRLK